MDEAEGPYKCQGLERLEVDAQRVLAAISRVARHDFVPSKLVPRAYEDRALPIGCGQTISQPYIVALMSAHAAIEPGDKVLEIGTGSGYQAAVLAELGAEVYSVEIVPQLAHEAERRLAARGYDSVHIKVGDGSLGWDEHAPYRAILITAACPSVPPLLIDQLMEGGRLIAPLENPGMRAERLTLLQKKGEELIERDLGPVKFVPLTGTMRRMKDGARGASLRR